MKTFIAFVTETNHAWVSEYTGLSIEEVGRRYQQSVEDGVVCTIKVPQ